MMPDLITYRFADALKHYADAPGTLTVTLEIHDGQPLEFRGSVSDVKLELEKLDAVPGFFQSVKGIQGHYEKPTPGDTARR